MPLPTPGQPTAAAIGKGTTLGYSANTSSPSYTTVAELVDIKMPKHTASPVAIMRYDSPTVFEELIAAWAKAGEFELQLVYNKLQAAALYALFNVLAAYQVTKPDGSTWSYLGIITEFGDELPLKEKMTNSCKVSISGAPTPSSASA
jgi:hypothetical protein